MVKLLTRWSCDQGSDSGGLTAIHWAAERGHAECVEVLLKAGAKVNSSTNNGYCSKYEISSEYRNLGEGTNMKYVP